MMSVKSKNIHVLPTDKPSRLHLQNGNLVLHRLQYTLVAQHIYITSDEEIKEGDHFLGAINLVYKFTNDDVKYGFKPKGKKIILTTDQDLVKDGVQAIDDEFLEWFVKNPSCEWVDVEKYNGFKTKKAGESWLFENDKYNWKGDSLDYKAIIPEEESKQETLEEAAEKFAKNFGTELDSTRYYAFIEGAKWQQDKNKYSEEEVLNFTQTIIQQYKFGNTNIEQLGLLKETLQTFKNK